MSRTAFLDGGIRDWSQMRTDFQSWTAAWQDGSGMNIAPLPQSAPYSSWLWAWSPDGDALIRVRVDGQTCHTAVLTLSGAPTSEVEVLVSALHPWDVAQGQVKQYRGSAAADGGLGARYLCVTVEDTGDGALTFFVPSDAADRGWTS